MGDGISYFAYTAQYADRFSHTMTVSIIAEVVLGDVYSVMYSRDESLQFPPVKEAHDLDLSLLNVRYDSVRYN